VVFEENKTAANIPSFTECFKCLAPYKENLPLVKDEINGPLAMPLPREKEDILKVIKTLLYFSFCHAM
jgi:hypothetical protein